MLTLTKNLGVLHRARRTGERATVSGDHWRSLYYLNLYRLVLSAILVTLTIFTSRLALNIAQYPAIFASTAIVLSVACGISFFLIRRGQPSFHLQAHFQVSLDLVVYFFLLVSSGGIESGFGVLMIVTLAGAGVLFPTRETLIHATLGTFLAFAAQLISYFGGLAEARSFATVGIQALGMYGVGFAIATAAQRLRETSEVARRRKRDLAALNEISRQIVDLAAVGVAVVDDLGKLKLLNSKARELLGVSENSDPVDLGEVLGEKGWTDRSGNSGNGPLNKPRALLLGRSTVNVTSRDFEGGTIHFFEDLSEIQQRAAQQRLAGLGRLAAAVAHEIRNPLSAIIQASDLLPEAVELSSETKELIRIIVSQSERMDRTVRSILDIGRHMEVQRDTIALGDWLAVFSREFAESEGLDIKKIVLDLTIDTKTRVNSDHLYQILSNLCQNAIRHGTEVDGATVKIKLSHSSDSATVYLDVINRGSPIDHDEMEKVFEPFYTTHSRGTGLGLFIARELCEVNGLELDLLNEADKTTFRITARPLLEPGVAV